jgi:hypothetical protein
MIQRRSPHEERGGSSRVRSLPRIRSASSKPSISGIWTCGGSGFVEMSEADGIVAERCSNPRPVAFLKINSGIGTLKRLDRGLRGQHARHDGFYHTMARGGIEDGR